MASLKAQIDYRISSYEKLLADTEVFMNNFKYGVSGANVAQAWNQLRPASVAAHRAIREAIDDVGKLHTKLKKEIERSILGIEGLFPGGIGGTLLKGAFLTPFLIMKAVSFAAYVARWTYEKMVGFGTNVYGTQRVALGAGAKYGSVNALGSNVRYLANNPEIMLNAIARGRFDITSSQAMALTILKIPTKGRDTGDVLMDAIVATAIWARTQSNGNLDVMATNLGISSLFGDNLEYIHALRNMEPEDLHKMEELYNQNKNLVNLKENEISVWMIFTNKLDIMKQRIETRIISALTKVSKLIGDISEILTDRVLEFLNSDLAKDIFKKLEDYLIHYIDSINTHITDTIGAVLTQFEKLHDWIEKLTHKSREDWIKAALRGPTYGLPGPIVNPIERVEKSKGIYQRSPRERARLRAGAGEIKEQDIPPLKRRIQPTTTPPEPGSLAAPIPEEYTTEYSGLHLKSQEAVIGGASERGLVELARREQQRYPGGMFSALHDRFHIFENPSSAHNLGLAFDFTIPGADYDNARSEMRDYLNQLGFKEGNYNRNTGDYWIEPGTANHIHVQFNTRSAAERYYKLRHPDKIKDDKTANKSSYLDVHGIPTLRNNMGNQIAWVKIRPGILQV